ncbi:MAG: hypothetical protein DMG54_33575 [Acidobacteria bacterium]|nr:MAG: hypothetical protein DMG54_33575 [Acidobacteriota bacterium]
MLETTMEMHRGRRLRVAQLGNGPPLILLHGYPDTLQVWSRLAPLLSAAHRVIAFDWPGMGQSEAWPGGATPYDMAERLRVLLNDWQLDKAIVLGMDMGGQPALAFAANHRQRVQSLIVMNSLVQWDEKTSWEINLLRRFGWNRFALRYLPGIVFGRALSLDGIFHGGGSVRPSHRLPQPPPGMTLPKTGSVEPQVGRWHRRHERRAA